MHILPWSVEATDPASKPMPSTTILGMLGWKFDTVFSNYFAIRYVNLIIKPRNTE